MESSDPTEIKETLISCFLIPSISSILEAPGASFRSILYAIRKAQ